VAQDPYPTSQYVLWAYRLLLGREPEDPQAVELYPETSRRKLVERFLSCPEFLGNEAGKVALPHHRYMVELDDGLRFWLISGDEFVSPAIATGNYEETETAFVKQQVRRGMAVLDLGANLGWFTVQLGLLVGAEGRVDAFEPRSDLADLLNKTLTENRLTNVTVHNCALGSENAHGQMIWSSHDINPGGTNLVLSDLPVPGIIAQPVFVKTLDSCVSHRIDFIKIDVEGSELLALRGAERILIRDRPAILIEINSANLLRTSGISATEFGSYVEQLGYRLFQIAADGSCGRRIPTSELSAIRALVNVAMLPTERADSAAPI